MTGQSDPAVGPALVLRSPERLIRVGLVVCAATVFDGLSQLVPLGYPAAQVSAPLAITMTAVILARRLSQSGTTIDDRGVRDRGVFRCTVHRWSDIAAFSVGRTAGQWGGMCVRVHLRRGGVQDLRGTQVYSMVPEVESLASLADTVALLEGRLTAATAGATLDAWLPAV